ncbi:hypothetical protein EV363DRAFT_1168279, partial [Boletus edulis]
TSSARSPKQSTLSPKAHTRVTRYYNWAHIAECTEVVYDAVVRSEPINFKTRMRRTMLLGPFATCGAHLHYHLCLEVGARLYTFSFSPQTRTVREL